MSFPATRTLRRVRVHWSRVCRCSASRSQPGTSAAMLAWAPATDTYDIATLARTVRLPPSPKVRYAPAPAALAESPPLVTVLPSQVPCAVKGWSKVIA